MKKTLPILRAVARSSSRRIGKASGREWTQRVAAKAATAASRGRPRLSQRSQAQSAVVPRKSTYICRLASPEKRSRTG